MYELRTIDGEVLIRRNANNMEEAIQIFSIMKNLNKQALLTIFRVFHIN